MPTQIYRVKLTLMEHTFFASREVGIFFETEPLIGNYALSYALNLCAAPYQWAGAPRYKEDLSPLNAKGIYVTPATFSAGKLRYAISQFNAQSDSYYFRFDQNAIATDPNKKSRAANFPQAGKIRMLGAESEAYFYLIDQSDTEIRLPNYIRLGKFNSKAKLDWQLTTLKSTTPVARQNEEISFMLNAADLATEMVARLQSFSIYNIYPAPLLSHCYLSGNFWHVSFQDETGKLEEKFIPVGLSYGVEDL